MYTYTYIHVLPNTKTTLFINSIYAYIYIHIHSYTYHQTQIPHSDSSLGLDYLERVYNHKLVHTHTHTHTYVFTQTSIHTYTYLYTDHTPKAALHSATLNEEYDFRYAESPSSVVGNDGRDAVLDLLLSFPETQGFTYTLVYTYIHIQYAYASYYICL